MADRVLSKPLWISNPPFSSIIGKHDLRAENRDMRNAGCVRLWNLNTAVRALSRVTGAEIGCPEAEGRSGAVNRSQDPAFCLRFHVCGPATLESA